MANGIVSGLSKKTCPAIVRAGAGFEEVSGHFHATVSTEGRKKIRFHGGNFLMEIVEMFGTLMPAKPCAARECGKRGTVDTEGERTGHKLLKFLICPLSTLSSPPTGEEEVGTSPPPLRPGGETEARRKNSPPSGVITCATAYCVWCNEITKS